MIFYSQKFNSNENNWSDGGAIKVGTGAKIYVGNSYFEGNTAERMGGAISGTASILQVLDSSFRSNIAKLGGAIATNLPEAQLVLGGCEFDANDAIMGPKYGPAVAANGRVEDLGENDAQPEELMCLDCELTSGIRIREPEPQAQPVQDINVPMPMDEPLPSAAPLDTEGMGVLLPTNGDEDTAPLVVVEEDAEVYINENTEDANEETTEEVTADTQCVQCTNIPTKYMLQTGLECATYTYAYERRCGTEYGWWGRDGNLEYCQYSCWKNGAPHMTQGDLPCCERADADDEVVIMETLVEKDAVLAEIANEDKEIETTVTEEDVEPEAEPEQAEVAEESIEETVEEVSEESIEEFTEEVTEEAIDETADEPTEDVVLGEIEIEDAAEDVIIDDTENEEVATTTDEEESVEEAASENDEETEDQSDSI